MNLKFKSFTLAEILITLMVVGLLAILTIPQLLKSWEEQATVARLKKYYSIISQAAELWQSEEECHNESCLTDKINCTEAFKPMYNHLNIIQKRENYFQNPNECSWIPTDSYTLNGEKTIHAFQGISQSAQGNWGHVCDYMMNDGTLIRAFLPDLLSEKQSGVIYIDVNGKKAPNRIGKDQFPIGFNAYNNPAYKGINPYYNMAFYNAYDKGLCSTRNGNICSPDDGHSPTAYVLKYNKLPDLSKLGYPQ